MVIDAEALVTIATQDATEELTEKQLIGHMYSRWPQGKILRLAAGVLRTDTGVEFDFPF